MGIALFPDAAYIVGEARQRQLIGLARWKEGRDQQQQAYCKSIAA
jgi:hypothetical protein